MQLFKKVTTNIDSPSYNNTEFELTEVPRLYNDTRGGDDHEAIKISLHTALELQRLLNKALGPVNEALKVTKSELDLAFADQKIEAIKNYKIRTQVGLKEAKDAVDSAMKEDPRDHLAYVNKQEADGGGVD
jgi:hypothetical protein